MKLTVGSFICALAVAAISANATEVLHPIVPSSTWISAEGAFDLDDDVYSADLNVSAEFSRTLGKGTASLYIDGAFRFLSYSYEYSTEGYLHNYCNLHVNGFNETYLGIKYMQKGFGLNLGWRFPPGEGSQLNKFHRLNIEPFYTYSLSDKLILGFAGRYNYLLEESEYKPGDEIGIKASLSWKFLWNTDENTGWVFSEVILYQKRIRESENLHLSKAYRKMDDAYQGMKIRFDIAHVFGFAPIPTSIGLNYEVHQGTLFGFEAGHRIGIFTKVGL